MQWENHGVMRRSRTDKDTELPYVDTGHVCLSHLSVPALGTSERSLVTGEGSRPRGMAFHLD